MSQNTAYPVGPINPASTNGAQLASFTDALRDNLYSSHLGTAQPNYSQMGMVWSQTSGGTIILKVAITPTTSVDVGVIDTTLGTFRVSPEEDLKLINIGSSTSYVLSAVESVATIYEFTGSPAATATITFPGDTKKRRIQFDNLTAQILIIQSTTQGGVGVSIPAGKTMLMYYNGTKIEPATSAYLTSADPTTTGTISGPNLSYQHIVGTVDVTLPSKVLGTGAVGPLGSASIIGTKGDYIGFEYRSGNLTTSTIKGYCGFVDSSGQWLIGNTAGTQMVTCDQSGNFTATGEITAFSDRSLKENIETIDDALAKVQALRGVSFTRKDQKDGRVSIGVIAQEVQKILPEVVHQDKESELLHVAYGNIVGLLIEAIKELSDKVDKLEGDRCH